MQWIQILLWAVPQQTGGTEEVRAKYSGWGRCSLKFSGQIHLKNSGKEEVRLSRSVFGGGELERPSDFMVASSWADPFCVYSRRVSIWCFQTSTFSPVSINQLKAAGKYPICFVWEHWVKKILCLPSDLVTARAAAQIYSSSFFPLMGEKLMLSCSCLAFRCQLCC